MKLPPSGIASVEYDMGYGADEFGDVLTGAFSSAGSGLQCVSLSRHRWAITQPDSDFKITINVEEKPPRRLGLFALPVLRVSFDIVNSEPVLQDYFFKRFFKYFHKGGG